MYAEEYRDIVKNTRKQAVMRWKIRRQASECTKSTTSLPHAHVLTVACAGAAILHLILPFFIPRLSERICIWFFAMETVPMLVEQVECFICGFVAIDILALVLGSC